MRDQVIGLEHKADGVVAVNVPITVGKVSGGLAVDDKIAGIVLVQAADDIQKGGFSAAGVAQDSNKLVLPEAQVYAFQGVDGKISHSIVFFDGNKLEHRDSLS